MALSPHDQLRDDFRFTIELALRDVLRPLGIRKQLIDLQLQVMSVKIMKHILECNWIVRQGLPATSTTGGTQEHNTAELTKLNLIS